MTEFLKDDFETRILAEGKYKRIIGIDEVGRGCWAGPVTVTAFIYSSDSGHVDNVTDSKKISLKKREEVYEKLSLNNYQTLYGDIDLIDSVGIGKSVIKLIEDLCKLLNTPDTLFLIDGRFSEDFGKNTIQVIKGDLKYYSIAAASIIAKVERDRLMNELSLKFPGYGLEAHKGYGTKKHIDALKSLGVTEIHRKSYKPIKNFLNEAN
ncbi:MAG: ribonuclease HII [Candidatus Dojkabacteria bacterium]|nr:ribonuclease HII [Candidatus Dojkabacteria bacterium]MDQ7020293.1 ribonuclease HII [Candidatus Dojkabacteria bacterium]